MRTLVLSLVAVLAVLAVLSVAAFAADVAGKWTAQVPGREGAMTETTFTFKVEGETLTGTIATQRGETAISDGKVSGDEISFSVVRNFGGNEMKMQYNGKVSGGEIQFKVKTPRGEREFTAKRAAS